MVKGEVKKWCAENSQGLQERSDKKGSVADPRERGTLKESSIPEEVRANWTGSTGEGADFPVEEQFLLWDKRKLGGI